MAEWSKAHDWKSCVPPKGTVSSNLTLSAITKSPFMGLFVMAYSEDKNSRKSEFDYKRKAGERTPVSTADERSEWSAAE